jgi:hypothetical protein
MDSKQNIQPCRKGYQATLTAAHSQLGVIDLHWLKGEGLLEAKGTIPLTARQ